MLRVECAQVDACQSIHLPHAVSSALVHMSQIPVQSDTSCCRVFKTYNNQVQFVEPPAAACQCCMSVVGDTTSSSNQAHIFARAICASAGAQAQAAHERRKQAAARWRSCAGGAALRTTCRQRMRSRSFTGPRAGECARGANGIHTLGCAREDHGAR